MMCRKETKQGLEKFWRGHQRNQEIPSVAGLNAPPTMTVSLFACSEKIKYCENVWKRFVPPAAVHGMKLELITLTHSLIFLDRKRKGRSGRQEDKH
jgi:hypothetical protein